MASSKQAPQAPAQNDGINPYVLGALAVASAIGGYLLKQHGVKKCEEVSPVLAGLLKKVLND